MRSLEIYEYRAETYIFPSRFGEIFEVDTGGKTDCAILGSVEDEREKEGEETGLDGECLETLFCLLPSRGVEGGEEQ